MEVYWWENHEPDNIRIQMGSQNWNHDQEHEIVKMFYMRKKHPEEGGAYPDRTIWKDKSLVLLAAQGKLLTTRNGYSLNESCEDICGNVIDICVDSELYYFK